ncbi:MAG: hypothetical protein SF029_11105 [bacterium]|nr:hypothetical protein [bacterium]
MTTKIKCFFIAIMWVLLLTARSSVQAQQQPSLADFWEADLEWNFDSSYIASVEGNSIQIRNAETIDLVQTLSGHTDRILDLEWGIQNYLIASVSGDSTIRIWNAITGDNIRTIPVSTLPVSIIWHFNRQRVLVVTNPENARLQEWEITTGNLVASHHIGFTADLVWNKSLSQLAYVTGGGSVGIVDADTFSQVASYRVPAYDRYFTNGMLHALSYNHTGTKLVTGSIDGTIYIWELSTGEILHFLEGNDNYVPSQIGLTNPLHTWVRDIAFNSDGTKLAAISGDGTIRVWDAESGEVLETTLLNTIVYSAAFSPNGQHIAFADEAGLVQVVASPSQFR